MTAVLFLTMLFQPPGTSDAIRVTISSQPSPYALSRGENLYSALACASTSTRVRTISAGQIRQVAEGAGIAFIDPALLPPMITRYVGRSLKGKLLSLANSVAPAAAAGSATVAAVKTQLPNGNAQTWAYVAMGASGLALVVPMIQKSLQNDVTAQQASITSGVNAAAITDMGSVYTVPVAGCSKSVMFLGVGGAGIFSVVLP
jgi:ribosomal protein L12E/L44/L45/RPP1/RPP2